MAVRKKTTKKVVRKAKPKTIKKTKKVTKPKETISKKTKPKKTVKRKRIVKEKKLVEDINNPTHVRKFLEKQNNHHLASHKGCFLKNLFSLSGYYKFVWFPILLLVFVLFFDFALKLIVHTNIPPIIIYQSKQTLIYSLLSLLILFVGFGAYFTFAYEAVKHNFRFSKVFPPIFKITLIFLVIDFILIIIGFFTFLQPYLALFNAAGELNYLFYLLVWSIIKFIILLGITAITYLLFKKLKHKV